MLDGQIATQKTENIPILLEKIERKPSGPSALLGPISNTTFFIFTRATRQFNIFLPAWDNMGKKFGVIAEGGLVLLKKASYKNP